jgi:hypothetical protein
MLGPLDGQKLQTGQVTGGAAVTLFEMALSKYTVA